MITFTDDFTISEVADRCGVNVAEVRDWIRAGIGYNEPCFSGEDRLSLVGLMAAILFETPGLNHIQTRAIRRVFRDFMGDNSKSQVSGDLDAVANHLAKKRNPKT
jgi:hypothetical protein